MQKPGEALHRLVEHIERVTNAASSVTVESHRRFKDKDTGRPREHDVVVTFSHNHHQIILAIECRDRSRNVGVEQIEAFHTKCQKTGIDRGIIVSSRGFTKTAVIKATVLNIGCLTLEEAAGFNWCMMPGLIWKTRHIQNVHIHVQPENADHAAQPNWHLVENGVRLRREQINQIGPNCLNAQPPDAIPEAGTIMFRDANPRIGVMAESGLPLPIKWIDVIITYNTIDSLVPFEFHAYFDQARGAKLYEAAIAKIDADGMKGAFSMVRNADGMLQVNWVADQKR